MEENKDDIIYDLGNAEDAEEQSPEGSDQSEGSEGSDSAESSEDPHEQELRRMVEDMGAETLLEIIRENRNAAIRQIISEVEADHEQTVLSGGSGSLSCASIFDLAALA